MIKVPFQEILKKPLRFYLGVAIVFSLVGLSIDLLEYIKYNQQFLMYLNAVTLVAVLVSLLFFLFDKRNIVVPSLILILSIVICFIASHIFLLLVNDPLWQFYFLRDTAVYMILIPFSGFLLHRVYVYILNILFCIDVIIMWYLSQDGFVKENAAFLIIMMCGFTFGIDLFSKRLRASFRNNEKLNILLAQKEKEILEKENQRIAEQVQLLKESVEIKNKELVSRAMLLAEQKEKANHSAKRLEALESFIPPEKLKDLESIARDIRSENSSHWEEFMVRFKDIHQGFYTNIKKDYPKLTAGELKLAAFLKLNLTTKEIALLTNTEKGSIEVSRSRLRKKLGLQKKDTFSQFLDKY